MELMIIGMVTYHFTKIGGTVTYGYSSYKMSDVLLPNNDGLDLSRMINEKSMTAAGERRIQGRLVNL